MAQVGIAELLEAGVHFGHQTRRWNPKMRRFIYAESGGIYMTYTTGLDDPASWALPKLIISGNQGWYPQVIGDPSIKGTDKLAGSQSRYFDQGKSNQLIVFTDTSAPAAVAAPCGASGGCR